jgi:SnoaL-like protein
VSVDRQASPAPGWSRSSGQTQVTRGLDTLQGSALDRILIAERIYRYGWGFDERDRELLGDCFTQDAVWEGNIMGVEPVGPFEGREAIVEWLCAFWGEQADQRRHVFTNVVLDRLTESDATAHAYLVLTSASGSGFLPVTAGPYRLLLRREPDGWRIAHLVGGWDSPF